MGSGTEFGTVGLPYSLLLVMFFSAVITASMRYITTEIGMTLDFLLGSVPLRVGAQVHRFRGAVGVGRFMLALKEGSLF